jgi:hypothetical protein
MHLMGFFDVKLLLFNNLMGSFMSPVINPNRYKSRKLRENSHIP